MAAKHPLGLRRIGFGIQHQVGFRLCLALVSEGQVHQVVEDGTGGPGIGLVPREESRGRGGSVLQGQKSHAAGKALQPALLRWQSMDLKIEQHLQAVLDLAQETVGLLQEPGFLVGEATSPLQAKQGRQRAAQSQGRKVSAVGQLQKLDGVLDIADAAPTGFYIQVLAPGGFGPGLNPPLEGLDLVDLGKGKIFAINERLDRLEKLTTQAGIPGNRANLDQGLAFPRAAHGVVVGHGGQQVACHRPAATLGTETQVHAVAGSGLAGGGQQPHHLGGQAGEKLPGGEV